MNFLAMAKKEVLIKRASLLLRKKKKIPKIPKILLPIPVEIFYQKVLIELLKHN